MGRRTLLLLAALVVAALGTTGIFLYVNGVDRRAQADYTVVKVLVANTTIEAGTTAQDAAVAGAIGKRDFLKKSLEGLRPVYQVGPIAKQVALAPIAAGEPIVEGLFGTPGETNRLLIPSGLMAVSVQLDDPGRVAGFVDPGAKVMIFLTSSDGGAAGAGQKTGVLLPSVQVLAIGNRTASSDSPATSEAVPSKLVTLGVNQRDAQKLVLAQQVGKLSFALLDNKSTVGNEPPTTARDLLP